MKDSYKETILYSLLILIVIATIYAILTKFSQPVTINMEGYTVTGPSLFEGDVKDFVMLAQRFAKYHEYNRTGYNCVNYSQDLKQIADQLGFKVKMVKGCNDQDESCHQWLRLEVDFSPQSATFMDYSKDYPNQEVLED